MSALPKGIKSILQSLYTLCITSTKAILFRNRAWEFRSNMAVTTSFAPAASPLVVTSLLRNLYPFLTFYLLDLNVQSMHKRVQLKGRCNEQITH